MCMYLTADRYMVGKMCGCVYVVADSLGMNVHSGRTASVILGGRQYSIQVTYNMSFTTTYGTRHKNVTVIKNCQRTVNDYPITVNG